MSTRTLSYTFAGGETLAAPGGRFFFVKAASGLLDIRTRGNTTAPIEFVGVGAGLKFGPVPIELAWRYLDITSASAQVVQIIISDDAEVDIASTVNVAGNVTTSEMPSSSVATPPRVSVGTSQTLLIAANINRKSVMVCAPQANTDSVNVGPAGSVGASQGLELQPGQTLGPIATTAALYGWAASGTQSVQTLEQV